LTCHDGITDLIKS